MVSPKIRSLSTEANEPQDPLPGFKRLPIRRPYGYHDYVVVASVVVAAGLLTALYLVFVGLRQVMIWLSFPEALINVTMNVGLMFGLLLGYVSLLTINLTGRGLLFVNVANRLEEWHHVRSFEVRRRRNTGLV